MASEIKPIVIFDSRIASKTYKDLDHYRSTEFFVPGGCIALVELTTGKDIIENMTFTAIRVPIPSPTFECYENSKCIGKRYRRWKCCQSLGENIVGSNTDDFAKSVVRWGNDKVNKEIVQFEYITRPGFYYLTTLKCTSPDIENCAIPTIFEVTIFPIDGVPDLDLPCSELCPDE